MTAYWESLRDQIVANLDDIKEDKRLEIVRHLVNRYEKRLVFMDEVIGFIWRDPATGYEKRLDPHDVAIVRGDQP